MRNSSRALLAPLVALAWAAASFAGEAEPAWMQGLRAAFASESETKGLPRKAIAEMRDELVRHIDTPAAEAMLLRMAELAPHDADPRRASIIYRRLAQAGRPDWATRELLIERAAANLRNAGEFETAFAVESSLGFIRHWTLAGPFGHTSWSLHDAPHPPETVVDFAAGDAIWSAYESPGSGRMVDVFAPLESRRGVAYALAQLRSDATLDALLVIDCASSLKVWWNGREVASVDRGRAAASTRVVIPVRLGEGWNRLLLKVGSPALSVACRLVGSDGAHLNSLEPETTLTLHDHAAFEEPAQAATVRPRSAALARSLDTNMAAEAKALIRAALGSIALAKGEPEGALEHLEEAARLHPTAPHLRRLALAQATSPILPRSMRHSLSQQSFALAAEGGCAPSMIELARRLHTDRRSAEAISTLRRAAEAAPSSAIVRLAMAEIASAEGWTNEARSWAQDAEKADPNERAAHLFWGGFFVEMRDYPRALSAYRQAVTLDESDAGARRVLARLLASSGDPRGALREFARAVESAPAALQGYIDLARAWMEAGRSDEAGKALMAGLTVAPSNAVLRQQMGEVHLRTGDKELAASEWRRALELRPGWHDLRRQLEALKGEPHDFSAPYSVDVREAAARVRDADYSGSDEVLVEDLTVIRIYEDGSWSEITHQARKALTPGGVEGLSVVEIRGELMEARTILPDGSVLEPTVLPGQGELTMPGVLVGSVVEYKYRRDYPAPAGGFLKLPSWYFRGLDTPHARSDYVVIAPRDMPLTVVRRNWAVRSQAESLEEFPVEVRGGMAIRRWLGRNMRPLRPVSGHPHASELLPHVDIGVPRAMETLAAELVDAYLRSTVPTGRIRDLARPLVKDVPDDRAKARAVFRWVNENVRAESAIRDATQALLARAGDRATLTVALLQAAGVDARVAAVRPRPEAIPPDLGPGPPDWTFPRGELFHNVFVAVPAGDGGFIWLDPRGRHSPFGVIPPEYQGGTAFVLPSTGANGGRDGSMVRLPWGAIDGHGESTRTELVLDARARTLTGRKEFVYSGSVAARYREAFAESGQVWRESWAEERLSASLRGSRLVSLGLERLDEPDEPFAVAVEFALPEVSLRDLPTGLDPLRVVEVYVRSPERSHPMKVSSPLVRRDSVRIDLPGVAEVELPKGVELKTQFGSYTVSYDRRGDSVWIDRSVTILPQAIQPEDYADFVGFCRAMDSAERAPLMVAAPQGE